MGRMKTCTGCKLQLPVSEFNARRASSDGLSPLCKTCKNIRYKVRYSSKRDSRIAQVRARTKKNLAALGRIKIQSGCQVCGLKDERSWLFDFDHLRDKRSLVSRMISHRLDKIVAESEKCQVLCSNCHRETTYRRALGTTEPVPPKKCLQVPVLMRNWQALLEFKNRPCMDCGRSYHFSAMDCDHRDPKTKAGDPSNMARQNSEAKFLAELSKCDVVCSNCHRIRERSRPPPSKTLSVRDEARALMSLFPGMSYQKAIRDTIARREGPQAAVPDSMAGAYVTAITAQQAASVILKYEWLGTMGHPQACYGLWFDLDGTPALAGVVCFGFATGNQARNVCGPQHAKLAIALERGACVHWAPKNAASWFIPKAIEMASREHGWKIFYAYSDPEANEVGTIYQACNWLYLGKGPGHGPTRERWIKPDGTKVSSRALRYWKLKPTEALRLGWKRETVSARGKYVWFEGSRSFKKQMQSLLVHAPVPYPKRCK